MGIFVYLPAVQFSTQFLMFCCEQNDKREEPKFLKTIVFLRENYDFQGLMIFKKCAQPFEKPIEQSAICTAFGVKIDANMWTI